MDKKSLNALAISSGIVVDPVSVLILVIGL